jgi:hypothetical protein
MDALGSTPKADTAGVLSVDEPGGSNYKHRNVNYSGGSNIESSLTFDTSWSQAMMT